MLSFCIRLTKAVERAYRGKTGAKEKTFFSVQKTNPDLILKTKIATPSCQNRGVP